MTLQMRSSWSSLTGSSLHRVIDQLRSLSPAQWQAESLCEGWSIADVAGHLAWRLDPNTIRSAGIAIGTGARAGLKVIDTIAHDEGRRSPAALIEVLDAHARVFVQGDCRDLRADLVEAVVHGFDAFPDGQLEFSPSATWECVRVSTPLLSGDYRALIKERTLVAADADWSVGTGPTFESSAREIVLAAYGRRTLDISA
ncbi:maleylpyruvate isomerase N-terminal domain-containing protein [Humidisolicoccus flavus]|uniref:maleylpyruvate isomerase N-terminal domain-containing protein n=1 Tax=Humidisolicoccus flavus TaxID=3111414 RepID=UPI00324E1822